MKVKSANGGPLGAPEIGVRFPAGAHGVGRPARQPGLHARRRAFMLIECLVYVLVAFILSGVAYVAFYQCMDNSLALRRSTDDISNALRAGERWRADVRSSGGRIRTENVEGAQVFVVPSATGDVAYQFSTNGVSRRVGSGAWVCLLEKVNSSTMQADVRGSIEAWRWELELKPRFKKQGRLRPLFTFTAVPERSPVK